MLIPNEMKMSPFYGSVKRRQIPEKIYDITFDLIFESKFNEFFIDNFCSNFTSNFKDPNSKVIYINNMIKNSKYKNNPPVGIDAFNKLRRFKMCDKFCQNIDNKIEIPTCSSCMSDIKMESDTILSPCGHLYHMQCAAKIFQQNNFCPLCSFELPTDDVNYEKNKSKKEGRIRILLNL